jgi:hypothetical protein
MNFISCKEQFWLLVGRKFIGIDLELKAIEATRVRIGDIFESSREEVNNLLPTPKSSCAKNIPDYSGKYAFTALAFFTPKTTHQLP